MTNFGIPFTPIEDKTIMFKTKTCKTCIFYTDIPGYVKKIVTEPTQKECRKNPPQILLIPEMNQITKQPQLSMMFQYPRLAENFPACSFYSEKIL